MYYSNYYWVAVVLTASVPRFKRFEGIARPVRFKLTSGGISKSRIRVGSLGPNHKRDRIRSLGYLPGL